MLNLLPAVLPVGTIILIGFIVGRTLSLKRETLSQLAFFVLSPALFINGLYRNTLSWENSWNLLLGLAITSMLIYLVAIFLSKITHLSNSSRTALVATSLFSNNGNMGLPVVDFALGEAGLARAIIYLIGGAILVFGFGPAIIQGKGMLSGLKLIFKLPLFWAILTAFLLRFLAIQFPDIFNEGVEQVGVLTNISRGVVSSLLIAIKKIGETAIVIPLILLGMQLASTRFRLNSAVILAGIMRLLVAPAIAFGVGRFLNLSGLDLQVLVLQSAMPTAVNSLVLVTEFGGDKDLVARSIINSTLFSFITIPIILFLIT